MAVVTTNYYRFRTEVKLFSNPSLPTAEAAYQTYEAAQAADTTKTWSVRVVTAYYDGANHVIVAEGSYIERNENFYGQVPEV